LQFVSAWDQCDLRWIGRKGWYPYTLKDFRILWDVAKDGVVIQEAHAPTGVFRGVGTCRYIKKRQTLDCRVLSGTILFRGTTMRFDLPDGIYEFEVTTGEDPKILRSLRARPDKILPNDPWYEKRLHFYLGKEEIELSLQVAGGARGVSYFEDTCPETAEILKEGKCLDRLFDSLVKEAHNLGLTYRNDLRFPTVWSEELGKRVPFYSRETELQLLYIRYASYVAAWTGRDLEDLATASSSSLASCNI